MFTYLGKSFDPFEDVWNMWMRYAEVKDYIHADVLSYRCFAFSCGKDVTKWFSPIQTMEAALVELCSNLGIQDECAIIPASDWGEQLSELKWPVLLADICLDVGDTSVREKFYQGTQPFCLLYGHSDGKRLVYASSGIPFIELSQEQVREKLSASKGYVLTGNMPMQIRMPSAGEILRRGMQWRKDNLDTEERLERLCVDQFERNWNRATSLSVQYGLMNYQIQLSKVVRFCVQEMRVPDFVIEKLNDILFRIGQIYCSHAYGEIVRVEEDFWTLIGSIEENCNV